MTDPRNFDLAKIKPGSLEWAVFVSARMLADDMLAAHMHRQNGSTPEVCAAADNVATLSLNSYRHTMYEFCKARAEGRE